MNSNKDKVFESASNDGGCNESFDLKRTGLGNIDDGNNGVEFDIWRKTKTKNNGITVEGATISKVGEEKKEILPPTFSRSPE